MWSFIIKIVNIALKFLQLRGLTVYINYPDYDKGNLIIAYVTLDGKFSVTAVLFTEVSLSTFIDYKYTF